MSARRAWSVYPATYRAQELATIARWIMVNSSGSVVGLPGIGKSNLLGFLCHRPDVLRRYQADPGHRVALVAVDLNNLPASDLATLYRTVLRSFYEFSDQFETELAETIRHLYIEYRGARDPFLVQSAVRELLQQAQNRDTCIVLVFDRFDKFCERATPSMTDTLRGLRDGFKDTLSYIVGMRQEAVYLPDPSVLGELHELLDLNVCWVGVLNEADGRQLIATVTAAAPAAPGDQEIKTLMALSGGHPALLKAACHWWLTAEGRPASGWEEVLLNERSVCFRLQEIWVALSQEEQRVLADIQMAGYRKGDPGSDQMLQGPDRLTLDRLVSKGIGRWVEQGQPAAGWRISGSLLASYIATVGGRSRGKLWYDAERRIICQGQTPLEDLPPLETSLLKFMINYPRVRHTYTDLIEASWPEKVHKEGVTTEALYQVVRGLRRRIEPIPAQPLYIVNWRGRPEGGYQCFPEGRPR